MLNNVQSNIKNSREKFDKICLQSIEKARQSSEYKQNEMQINSIKRVLVRNADVPEKLVNWLIQAVEDNVSLEYETANQNLFKFIREDIILPDFKTIKSSK